MDNGASSYRRFLAGDESGIVEIIRDYKDGLILYLNGYVKNIHIAEELMEDVFVKLVVKKPRYSEKFSFKTWLYTIGRNAAIDWFRRNSRWTDTPIEELEGILTDEKDLEREYLREEQKITLHRAMGNIKEEYRAALYLSFFEDLSNAEIAAVMRKSRRQVENLIYRGKQSLKSELEKEGFVYEEL